MNKYCKGCHIEKNIDDFNLKNKYKQTRQSQCKSCTRLQVKNHYYNNRQYYLSKAKIRNKLNREKFREYVWSYLKKHPCIDCGEKDIVVLTFDHFKDKKTTIGDMVHWRYNIDDVKKEIKKCEVRCANCHMRKTAKDFKWGKLVS